MKLQLLTSTVIKAPPYKRPVETATASFGQHAMHAGRSYKFSYGQSNTPSGAFDMFEHLSGLNCDFMKG